MTVEVVKGINVTKYDLSVSEKGVKALKKEGMVVSEAENGVYYLPKGVYEMTVFSNAKFASKILVLE